MGRKTLPPLQDVMHIFKRKTIPLGAFVMTYCGSAVQNFVSFMLNLCFIYSHPVLMRYINVIVVTLHL